MQKGKRIGIVISPVKDHSGEYVAYFRSEFLQSTYTVYFKDTITGALALYNFGEMIRKQYDQQEVDFLLSEEEVPFRSEALVDVINRQHGFVEGKVVARQV